MNMPLDIPAAPSLPLPRVIDRPPSSSDPCRAHPPPPRPHSLFDLIARQNFFANLRSEQLRLLSNLAMEVQYASDEWIFREGDPANRFFVILKGYVSVEIEYLGGSVPIRTLGPGDDLGWAWLFPPYLMHFSARTIGPVCAIFFYGTRLREACEQDHELGYQLMKRVAEALVRNLKATERRVPGAKL
jgi:CRP/FNR family transcriptional regulator, cyclic AMP receptor protein